MPYTMMYLTYTKGPIIMLVLMALMTLNMESKFTMWMMMEMTNMMFLMSILASKKSIKAMPTMIPIQFMSSTMILASISINEINIEYMKNMMFTLALSMKMGLSPMDTWLYKTIKNMSWTEMTIMMTAMKIPPFMLFSMANMNTIMLMMMCLSPPVSAIKSIKMNSIKELMAPSSIIHSTWMMTCIMNNMKSWTFYFTVYSMTMILLLTVIKSMSPKKEFLMIPNLEKDTTKMSLMMTMITMVGMPPLATFMAKILMMTVIIKSSMWLVVASLILSSTASIIFYTRIIVTMLMTNTSSPKINKSMVPKIKAYMITLVILSAMILVFTD